MRLSITLKLLLMVLLIAIIAVFSMVISMRYGFDRNLNRYQNSLEQSFNRQLTVDLSAYYAENQSWKNIKSDRDAWLNLVVDSYFSALPEKHERMHEEFANYQAKSKEMDSRMPRQKRRLDRRFRDRLRRSSELGFFFNNIALYDENKTFIAGATSNEKRPINFIKISFDNQTVGFLGHVKKPPIYGRMERQFSQSIKKMVTLTGLVILVFIITVAYPLVRYFTRRIEKITLATQSVTAGNYAVRIDASSSDELGQLANHFNLLTDSLERSARSQKNMLADIAHELRTPVTVIRSRIEALQDGIYPMDQQAIDMLHKQILELGALINDVHELSLSDIGALSYHMHTTDFRLLIRERTEQLSAQFKQADIHMQLTLPDTPVWVSIDDQRMNQLLNNLINNSCRYTNADGQIKISLTVKSHRCLLEVSDSAPGVTDRQLEHLFDRFFRTETSRNKKSGGSGLGLSISQNIAAAHKGTLTADHSPLGGLLIQLQLPLVKLVQQPKPTLET